MRKTLALGLILLGACTPSTQAAPLEPCCPQLAVVTVAPLPESNDRRALTVLVQTISQYAGAPAAVDSVRVIDAYRQVELSAGSARFGALLRDDTVVNLWEVNP